jgi:2-phospho-L-lactate guanylyltransferase
MREDHSVGRSEWVAVMPIKPLSVAKSRLRGAAAGVRHDDLVLAMARDTVAAALACGRVDRVVVVTDDPLAGPVLVALGAQWLPDAPRAGLNAAFAHGARQGAWVAALTADLPALRPDELAAALDAATSVGTRAYVDDAAGTGTVLLTAPAGVDLDPRFGPGSAAAHARSRAVRLTGDWPGLRRDVDTPADLAVAVALGVGSHTTELLPAARYGYAKDIYNGRERTQHSGVRGQAAGPWRRGGPVQGTVATFDPGSGTGTVLLDDGSEIRFPAEAFANSGLRLLRLGQRVTLDYNESGQLIRVRLPTML